MINTTFLTDIIGLVGTILTLISAVLSFRTNRSENSNISFRNSFNQMDIHDNSFYQHTIQQNIQQNFYDPSASSNTSSINGGFVRYVVLPVLLAAITSFLFAKYYRSIVSYTILAISLLFLISAIGYSIASWRVGHLSFKRSVIRNGVVGIALFIAEMFLSASPVDLNVITYIQLSKPWYSWINLNDPFYLIAIFLNLFGFACFVAIALQFTLNVFQDFIFYSRKDFLEHFPKDPPTIAYVFTSIVLLIGSTILMRGYFNAAIAHFAVHSLHQPLQIKIPTD